MAVIAELPGEREFHQACAESVRRSQEDARLLEKRIDTLLAGLATVSAEPRLSTPSPMATVCACPSTGNPTGPGT